MSEEAQRVFDAMDGLATISDPTARAQAVSEVLSKSKERGQWLKDLRREAVLELMARDGASYRKVAAELSLSLGTVQDIVRGYSRPWAARPRKESGPEEQQP